jgi:Rrf2 family transcriptional regulator, iron-sulfur cluster assembly transcription factor
LTIPVRNLMDPAVRLSSKARYAIRAIFDLAYHGQGEPLQVRDIAERQAIPPRFLEQIFQDLKRAGLVQSKRGPRGGYRLARRPAELRVGDVLRAVEGPISLASDTPEDGDPIAHAVTDAALEEVGRRINACFDAFTLEALCEGAHTRAGRRAPPRRYVYSI